LVNAIDALINQGAPNLFDPLDIANTHGDQIEVGYREDAERLRNSFFYEIGAQVRRDRLDVFVVDAKHQKADVTRAVIVGISSIKHQCQATSDASRAPPAKKNRASRHRRQSEKLLTPAKHAANLGACWTLGE
jgi:hypothetical protein